MNNKQSRSLDVVRRQQFPESEHWVICCGNYLLSAQRKHIIRDRRCIFPTGRISGIKWKNSSFLGVQCYFTCRAVGTLRQTDASPSRVGDKSCHDSVDVICASTMDFSAVLELKSTGRNIHNVRVLCTPDIRSELQLLFIIFCGCLRVCLHDSKESVLQFIVLPGVCMFKFHNRASTGGRASEKWIPYPSRSGPYR